MHGLSVFAELRRAEGRGHGAGNRRAEDSRQRAFASLYCRYHAGLRRGLARRGFPFRQSAREPHLWLRIVVPRLSAAAISIRLASIRSAPAVRTPVRAVFFCIESET